LQRQFATAEACQQYLTASRGPDGFHGPRLWRPARLPHADTPTLSPSTTPAPLRAGRGRGTALCATATRTKDVRRGG